MPISTEFGDRFHRRNGSSAQLQIDPDITSTTTAASAHAKEPASTNPPGWTGIAQLGMTGTDTVQLSSANGLQALWNSGDSAFSVQSGAGRVKVTFNPVTDTAALAPGTGGAAPRSVTATLTAKLNDDRSEHVATITGPAGFSVQTTSAGLSLSASASGRYTVTLSSLSGATAVTSTLPAVTLLAGQTMTLATGHWARLKVKSIAARIRGEHRTTRHVELRAQSSSPTAHVLSVSGKGRTLKIRVKVPKVPVGQAAVRLLISSGASRATATVAALGHARTRRSPQRCRARSRLTRP